MTALAYVVSHGRIVLEGTPDWAQRVRDVANRLTPKTCRRCGGEDGSHFPVGRVLCRNWRPFGPPSAGERLERMAADVVGRRPESIDALMGQLKAALGGEL